MNKKLKTSSKQLEYMKKYRQTEAFKLALKKYQTSDKGKIAKARADKKYRDKVGYNPTEKRKKYKRLHEINRVCKRKNATPKWVNMKQIQEIYKNCPKDYQVDHIIPLTNPLVCGLHVPWNLQYLTKIENCSKNNKFRG